ncbi:SCO family protein [Melittangium boletus]|uniref:SCO family protein n=1 Tax=Melittangium boletus TaxID=83453 RepID=UPI003DA3981C
MRRDVSPTLSQRLPLVLLLTAGALGVLAVALLLGTPRPPEPLPVYGQLPAFTLRDQDDRPFGDGHLRGHVFIADFIFTRCPTVCPVLTERMRQLQREAKASGVDVRFVSFSVDPRHDTPPRLKEYARVHGVDLGNWSLLTGPLDVVEQTVIDGFRVLMGRDADAGDEDFLSILHGEHFVLLDAQARVRGYYTVAKDTEGPHTLLRDAARLTHEAP